MSLFDINLFLGTQDELTKIIINNSKEKNKKMYFALNPDCYLKYLDDAKYKEILDGDNNLIYADGMGIIFSQKFLKIPTAKERIATTDLFPHMLEKMSKENINLQIYLLGGKEETVDRVVEKFEGIYPNIKFAGSHHGYFNKAEEQDIINEINEIKPDILFVGFGCPVQEKWVFEKYNQLQVSSFITCGGLFDYYSGNVKRAPLLMRKYGMEWLFRLIQEPKRLYKRYVFGNFRYVMHMLYYKLRGK